MNKKFLFFLYFTIILFITLTLTLSNFFSGFDTIKNWIIKVSTPAAAVAVGTGVFMKKFSFGDEERIRIGKKIIQGSLFSYAFILAIDLILGAIQLLIS